MKQTKTRIDPATAQRDHWDGQESNGPAPTPYLSTIADRLRKPPEQAVTNFDHFRKQLNITVKRGHASAHGTVERWLKTNLDDSKIDHHLGVTLDTGDAMIISQPYHHLNHEDLKHIEDRGGYVLHAHAGWAYLHQFCPADVYLIPSDAVHNFQRNLPQLPEPYVVARTK